MIKIRVLVIPSLVLAGLYLWSRVLEPLGWVSLIPVPFCAWAAIDSRRIHLTEYHSALAFRPLGLFLLSLSFPVVVVPWYLTERDLIREGRTLRREPTSALTHSSSASKSGV
jgi:hypothetical protein